MTTRPEVLALMYHEVTDDPTSSGFQRPGARRYTYTRDEFESHLAEIARSSFTPREIGRLGPTPPRGLLLTFDDGGISATSIAESLDRHGWKGHFFVVTDLIGQPGFLDATRMREIRRLGHHVGSHSHTHPDIFRQLPRARMMAEWRTSCDIISDILGEPCLTASVPGGDISRAVLESAAEAGLRYLFTSEPWLRPRRVSDCWILGRLAMKAGLAPHTLRALLEGRGWRRALFVRRAKGAARILLGPLYRHYVRRSTRPTADIADTA